MPKASDKTMEELQDGYIKELNADLTGLREVATILRIQRESGIIRLEWPGAKRGDPHGRFESEREDKWPPLGLMEAIPVIASAYANMLVCPHPQDMQERTGEAIAMGSFTAQPTRCKRCGHYNPDD